MPIERERKSLAARAGEAPARIRLGVPPAQVAFPEIGLPSCENPTVGFGVMSFFINPAGVPIVRHTKKHHFSRVFFAACLAVPLQVNIGARSLQ